MSAWVDHRASSRAAGRARRRSLFVAAARRRDTRRGEGALSRETRERDRSARGDRAESRPRRSRRPAGRSSGPPVGRALRPSSCRSAPSAPAPYVPPDPETIGVTRRQFFNRSIVALMSVGLAGFGAAVIAFLWRAPKGGFGAKINVGKLDDIKAGIERATASSTCPRAAPGSPSTRPSDLPKAEKVYAAPVLNGMETGIVALYQKCPHLGCRVPAVPDLAVVRVPVPRLAVQPGR